MTKLAASAGAYGVNDQRASIVGRSIVGRLSSPRSSIFWAVLGGLALGGICAVSPIAGLIVVLGLSFIVVATQRPVAIGYLMIGLAALTGGAQRDRYIPILTPNEIGLVLAVGLALPTLVALRRRNQADLAVLSLAFAVLVVGTVAIPVIDFLNRRIALDLDNAFKLVGPVQYFLIAWTFTVVARGKTDRRRLILWMLICGTIVAIVGLLQAARVGVVLTVLRDWFSSNHVERSLESDAGRITSLLGAWNALGMYMMTCIVISWATLPEMKTRIERSIAYACLAACSLTLVASGSFAGTLGTAIGVLIVAKLTGRVGKLVPLTVGALAFVGVAILVGQSILVPVIEGRLAFQYTDGVTLVPRTLADRFVIWRDIFMPPIREHFPRAVYPRVPLDYSWKWEESQYITLLFRTGLAGLVGHLLWVGMMVGWLFRKYRDLDGFSRSLAVSAMTIMIVLSIAGFTNAVFNYSGSVDYLWILFAMVAVGHLDGDDEVGGVGLRQGER